MTRTRTAHLSLLVLTMLSHQPAFAAAEVFALDPQNSARAATAQARIDQLFQPWSRSDAPGCAVGAIRQGRPVLEGGYGMADLEQGVAIRPDTVFNIASVSKQFTATAVALLEQDGALSWDDDVRKYVPELRDYGHRITLRHLANHTSGLRNWTDLMDLVGWNWVDAFPQSQLLDLIVRQKQLDFEPGAKWSYSNTGYILMAVIVERVSGRTLGAFARERIFLPLGMVHTRFYDDRTLIMKSRATGHVKRADGSIGVWRPTYEVVGDGAVLTTVQDMAHWEQNFLEPHLGRDPARLVATLVKPGRLNDGKTLDYALGLGVGTYRGLEVIRHSGGIPGYTTQMIVVPARQFAVTVFCNQPAPTTKLAQSVADVLLEGEFSGGEPTQMQEQPRTESTREASAPELSLSDKQLAAYAGTYYSEELDVRYEISARDGLWVRIARTSPVRWKAVRRDEFTSEEIQMKFSRDGSGRVVGFSLASGAIQGIRFKRGQRRVASRAKSSQSTNR